MKFPLKYIIFLICFFYTPRLLSVSIDENYEATWADIEVIGTDSITAEKIRALNLIIIGTTFRASESGYYSQRCERRLKKKMQLKKAHCSPVWYGDRVAYLIIETNGKDFDKKAFRTIPKNKDALIKVPRKLNDIFLKWETRMSVLMSSGNFSTEKIGSTFRDSSDPILHELALQLSQLVPKYNDTILDVVRYSPEVIERQKAAQLFAWSNHAENFHYVLEWNLLLDPNSRVRNDIARSFSQFIRRTQDEVLLENLMPAYCKQVTFPNHTDRNKALISINRILETHPKLKIAISPECKKTISYLSKTSILENIRDPAKNILKILEACEYA